MRKTQLEVVALGLLLVAFPCAAREAPEDMKEFNVKCPAPRILPLIEAAYQACRAGSQGDCKQFVAYFQQLLPEYDCQRPFDATPQVKYIVPAIWLASDEKLWEYMSLLSKLQTPDARRLFASPEFRGVLDGVFGEMFLDQSVRLERELRGSK